MKRTAPGHPKIRRFARRLQVPLYGAIGLLELLWHGTAKHAPAGNIGRFDDDEIADLMAWDGDPAELVRALVDCRLLDEHPEHRLLVHGWAKHSDDAVHMSLARAGQHFASGDQPKLYKLSKREREKALAAFQDGSNRTPTAHNPHSNRTADRPPRQAKPCQAPPEPSQSPAQPQPQPDPGAEAAAAADGDHLEKLAWIKSRLGPSAADMLRTANLAAYTVGGLQRLTDGCKHARSPGGLFIRRVLDGDAEPEPDLELTAADKRRRNELASQCPEPENRPLRHY